MNLEEEEIESNFGKISKVVGPLVIAENMSGAKMNESNTFSVLAVNEFGPVLKIRNSDLFHQVRVVYFKGQIKWDQQEEIEFVTSFSEASELTVYKVFSMINVPLMDSFRSSPSAVTPGPTVFL